MARHPSECTYFHPLPIANGEVLKWERGFHISRADGFFLVGRDERCTMQIVASPHSFWLLPARTFRVRFDFYDGPRLCVQSDWRWSARTFGQQEEVRVHTIGSPGIMDEIRFAPLLVRIATGLAKWCATLLTCRCQLRSSSVMGHGEPLFWKKTGRQCLFLHVSKNFPIFTREGSEKPSGPIYPRSARQTDTYRPVGSRNGSAAQTPWHSVAVKLWCRKTGNNEVFPEPFRLRKDTRFVTFQRDAQRRKTCCLSNFHFEWLSNWIPLFHSPNPTHFLRSLGELNLNANGATKTIEFFDLNDYLSPGGVSLNRGEDTFNFWNALRWWRKNLGHDAVYDARPY